MGVLAVRKSAAAVRLIEEVLELRDWTERNPKQWRDQLAFRRVWAAVDAAGDGGPLLTRRAVHVVDQEVLNAYYPWFVRVDTVVEHHAGCVQPTAWERWWWSTPLGREGARRSGWPGCQDAFLRRARELPAGYGAGELLEPAEGDWFAPPRAPGSCARFGGCAACMARAAAELVRPKRHDDGYARWRGSQEDVGGT